MECSRLYGYGWSYVIALPSRYLVACLQDDINSFLLFNEHSPGCMVIKYFSNKHKLHRLDFGLYEWACLMILQVISYSAFVSFKLHTYLLSSVADFLVACVNLALWLVNRVLNVPSVSPIYVWLGRLGVWTSAWYIIERMRQCPFRGHSPRQLQPSVFVVFLLLCSFCSMELV